MLQKWSKASRAQLVHRSRCSCTVNMQLQSGAKSALRAQLQAVSKALVKPGFFPLSFCIIKT